MKSPRGQATTPTISVVICTRNRGASAVMAVETALANDHPAFEVILVDQSATSETFAAVERFCADQRFRYLRSQAQGVGRARNLGLAAARGAIIAYTDDDCSAPQNWLRVIEQCFQRYPRVGIVFCNVKAAQHDPALGFIPAYERHDSKLVRTIWGKCSAQGIGAGIAVRVAAAHEIGGFDEALGPGARFPSCEEGDLAVRALLKHWWVYETDEVAVTHYGFRTWQQGKELTKRDWFGIGAAYIKPLKCGYWSASIVVGYEALMALWKPLSLLLRFKKPQGFRQLYYFAQGLAKGLQTPVDRRTILFQIQSLTSESKPAMFKLFKQDACRWIVPGEVRPESELTIRALLRMLYYQPGLRAMAWFRFGSWCKQHRIPVATGLIQYLIYRKYGLEIQVGGDIGGGLYIPHTVGTAIFPRRMGQNCSVIASVTIGMRNEHMFPDIGDNVFIGAGARVLGGVTIGDGAAIGANAVVLRNVPAGATAVGIPARLVGVEQMLAL